MKNALALGGRITSPQIYARQPRLVRLNRRTVCLGWILLFAFGLLAQAQTTSGVTLSWDPSSGSNVAGYRLYYGSPSGNYSQIVDVGNVTSFTLNLRHGRTYYFVVSAYDDTGAESGPSNEVAFSLGSTIKDFNGDGQSDLVLENTATGRRIIWFMNEGVPVGTADLGAVDPSWHIAGIGDFLGNGQSDLVWERNNGEHLIWILADGIPQYSISLPTLGGGWHVVGAGDFNGDGKADLVWENTSTGAREIWLMNNGVPTSAIVLPTVGTNWHIAGVGDFLGNGQADLVWENRVTGGREIWLMNNGVPTSVAILPRVDPSWRIAGTGDFMGTGQVDLVWENTLNGQHLIWVMNNEQPVSTIGLPTLPLWHIANH
jgi:hypothetical protein